MNLCSNLAIFAVLKLLDFLFITSNVVLLAKLMFH